MRTVDNTYVKWHENRIEDLERENQELGKENKELRRILKYIKDDIDVSIEKLSNAYLELDKIFKDDNDPT